MIKIIKKMIIQLNNTKMKKIIILITITINNYKKVIVM